MNLYKTFVRASVLATAIAGFTAISQPANAVTFAVSGVSSSDNTATADFVYDAALGKITIDILNTAVGLDPRITGFAFNAPTNVTGISSFMASGTQDDADWTADFDPDGINSPGNFGSSDVAGLTGPNLNGGDPNSGIAAGDTGTFMFILTGTDLDTLTELSFLNLLSDPQNPNSNTQPFLVRFQRTGPDGEGSDVGIPTEVIPLPASLPLLLGGLAGLGFISRRRRAV